MRIKTAFWTCSLLVPATVVPLATATSCSQVWGYKTPISIGTNIKGGDLDPYKEFRSGYEDLVDLNGDPVVDCLQSNYAIDVAHSGYYGYSLPQKWDSTIEYTEPATSEYKIEWGKGAFTDGSLGWQQYSSSDFVTSTTRSGKLTRLSTGAESNVSEAVYSYKNNIQANSIELVTLIANTMSQYFSYALHYQGTQLGTKWAAETETDSNLGIAWGGNLSHGAKSSDENRKLFESIFATNAVSGSGKTQATVRPTHVEFNFVDLPIVGYKKDASGNITGVNDATLKLLNGTDENRIIYRPKDCPEWMQYYSSVTKDQKEKVYDFRTDKTTEYTYNTYVYNNVPVIVRFNAFGKSFVNPTISSGFQVSDFYSSDKTIKDTIGNSWDGAIEEFTDGGSTPTFSSYQFKAVGDGVIRPQHVSNKYDADSRLYDRDITSTPHKWNPRVQQNDFIVLLNFTYKEDQTDPSRDRVTMTGLSSIFPACFISEGLKSGLKQDTFFTALDATKEEANRVYVCDVNKINTYVNNYLQLIKRSSTEGMKPHASDLNDESKALLKFLAYMFGDSTLAVDTANCITATEIAK